MTDYAELKNKIEAVLFAAGRVVPLQELCSICTVNDPALVQKAVEELKDEMKKRNSPILLTAEADGWKMTVREQYLTTVRNITPHTELPKALLETLAVIAWKQPIIQSQLIRMRTSAAYEHTAELLKLGFINKSKQGRSYVLKVTGKFFDYFDLPGNEDLKKKFEIVQGTEEMQELLGTEKKLGNLPVYQVPPEQQEEKMQKHEPEEELGKLEVFDAPAEEQKEDHEEGDKQLEEKEAKEAPDAPHHSAEEITEELLRDDESDVDESKQQDETGERKLEEEESEERKLHPQLEKFAAEGRKKKNAEFKDDESENRVEESEKPEERSGEGDEEKEEQNVEESDNEDEPDEENDSEEDSSENMPKESQKSEADQSEQYPEDSQETEEGVEDAEASRKTSLDNKL